MQELKKLIGQTVIVTDEDEFGKVIEYEAEVICVSVNDFYFYEKQEPMWVCVNVSPIGEMPESIVDWDWSCFCDIPLDKIRKA
jgi:hypothetical protein